MISELPAVLRPTQYSQFDCVRVHHPFGSPVVPDASIAGRSQVVG